MIRIHYISGLAITVFIGLHLFNHFCSIFGVATHIAVMDTLRLFYRNTFVETILLVAVLVQIVSGIGLFKKSRKKATSNFEKLHIWTGLYLAFFLIIHVGAVFSARIFLHLDTNFYFGVAGLNTFPFYFFFVPYYTLAILSFFGHIASVHNKKMKSNVLSLTPKQQSKSILLFGFVLTLIIFYGLTNHFNGVTFPNEYKIVIEKIKKL